VLQCFVQENRFNKIKTHEEGLEKIQQPTGQWGAFFGIQAML